MLVKTLATVVDIKTDTSSLDAMSYISTENMLPNFGGVCCASSLPKGKCTAFLPNDILISNIRPYFKKFWYSTFHGGCSNDVLVVRNNANCNPKYLYYALCSERFVSTYVASCKGTKMPRGNKNVLLDYDIPALTLEEQQHIVDIRRNIA